MNTTTDPCRTLRMRYEALGAEERARRDEANRVASDERDRINRHFTIDKWASQEQRKIDASPELMDMLVEATKHASRAQILVQLLRLTKDYAAETTGSIDADIAVQAIAIRLRDRYWHTTYEPR